MSDICTKIVDGDHNPPIAQKAESEYIMISSKNIVNDSIIHLDDVRHLSRADFELSNARTQVSKGDVLFTSVASLGRTCIYDLDYPITFQRSVTVICTKIFNRYLKLFLDSPIYQNYVGENARGTAQKGFYINQISDSWVPIPPLNEQIRIVEKAQSLLDIVQIINYSKEETSNNIIALKSKILDLAISGKLVRQDKSDEPAIELLKRINPQYQPTDNRHYGNTKITIPRNWCWVKLGEIFDVVSAKRVFQSEWQKTGIPFYRAREIVKLSNCGHVDNELYISIEHFESLKNKYGAPEADDIMLSAVGTIGKCYIVNKNDRFYYKDASVLCLKNIHNLNSEYIKFVLDSSVVQMQMQDQSKGTTVDTITIEKAKGYYIPLPPVTEQSRIVKAITLINHTIDKIAAIL